ncbi:MAG: hypothetical protein COY81_00225 [Candidatus Pacebacteria bacterium CG_4_10_14_0_8_um_filter_43_12]|nr:MAG: hypothetical protein COY81_00225 [Candidatus Pacebacteria bacterium CG_4_10_14_0_8_um_filter_43_12]
MNNDYSNIKKALSWLEMAQDHSGDGGVAAWYSLIGGWAPSYIETTGYIINTFLEAARFFNDQQYLVRAKRMGDFLLKMQHSSGGFRTHVPSVKKVSPPTVFNTGQDLLGLSELYTVTKEQKYLRSFTKAADFLVNIQNNDGSWTKNTYGNQSHVYHTRVAWGLLTCWQINHNDRYRQAAVKNLQWALRHQQPNGWFSNNQLPPPNIQLPYTHTISYAVEGLLWSGVLLSNEKYIKAAIKGTLPPLHYYLSHHFIPGTFDKDWRSTDTYSCLTGDAQLALMWLKLYELTKLDVFKIGSTKMLASLSSIQNCSWHFMLTTGAIPGSWPIWGDVYHNKGYCRLAYLNWATKFYLDALFLKNQLIKSE